MLPALAIVLGGSVRLAAGHPHPQRREIATFPAGASWDIILNKGSTNLDDLAGTASAGVTAMDIDLFDNEASTISALKNQNKHVICYFSAGSREDWREDASKFKADDYGQGLDGWAGENWVNVKSDNVRAIMKSRIELAAQKGCTAVDPDNVDGFSENQDGFGLEQSAYTDYVKFLASTAAANNLAIGLKNALDLIPDVVDVVQFAVNEQCHDYDECAKYKPLTEANKAVFNIEYGGNACSSPAGVDLSILIKNEDQNGGSEQASATPAASQTAVAEKTSVPTPAQTPVLTATPAVTPTGGSAVTPSSTAAGAETTPEPSADSEDQEDGDEDEDEDEDEDDEEDDEEEDAQPRWQRHHKHE
ncbi:endo alpha-1,4 polygalactosaminidase precursor [Paraphaeosphaeria minitans]|uniref:alpha-galactosidase n=1 Tax=Paraphaeosphaeria minitans TaxID=565426 RepID=A0A9P6GGT9_9PLEO|nr:endo alpha-1,4 polygalactosaminidase precursor [Paraphaeosphaeria minitans]